MKVVFLLALCCFTVWASPDPGTPVSSIVEGTYTTDGSSPYLDGGFAVSQWANHYELKTQFVQGDHAFDMKVLLQHAEGNEFAGSGEVIVRYPNGTGCKHKIGMRIFAYTDKVYVRTNSPASFPYDPGSPCVGAGPYVWHNHPEPYMLNQ